MSNEVLMDYFNPKIEGLEALLKQTDPAIPEDRKGFLYYPANGLNMVIYGAAGLGKTNLALQMALAAARSGKRVIYLTKDTKSVVLFKRITTTFNGFQNKEFGTEPGKLNVKPDKNGLTPVKENTWFYEGHYSDADDGGGKSKSQDVDFYLFGSDASEYLLEKYGEARLTNLEKMMGSQRPFFALADFDEVPANIGKLDRFGMMHSVYDALGCLAPSLKPLFDKMNKHEMKGGREGAKLDLFIVCDSLSAPALEENLRQQNAKLSAPADPSKKKPICLFVMDNEVMPQAMTVSFPPDVQISLGTRQESHDVVSRTICLVKTRFQDSLSDRTTYKIRDAGYIVEQFKDQAPKNRPLPGIEIFPPLSHEAAHLKVRERSVPARFEIPELDGFSDPADPANATNAAGLDGGGFTLLVTDYRCGATPLSLQYLLGEIAEEQKPDTEQKLLKDSFNDQNTLRSVLYISFSDGQEDVLSFIKKSERIRCVLHSSTEPKDKTKNGIYQFELKRGEIIGHASLNVFLPKFEWLSPEQAMSQVVGLLSKTASGCDGCPASSKPPQPENCKECHRIDRIVLDRVSRLQACWPLVKDAGIFISALVAMCKKYRIELMLIDDTATKEDNTSLFHSRWESMAQNIIRLRRVPFHGTETTTIELCSVGGSRSIVQKRPYELGKDMEVRDTFRGHTFLPTGEPVRCKVKVELCYDAENTPLYHEVIGMKKSIEAAMDGVEVKVLGRGDWAGINSTFSNLTSGSRDTCHVVAIDGIGLQQLVAEGAKKQVLHSFAAEELIKLLPSHILEETRDLSKGNEKEKRGKIRDAFREKYVTRSSSIAIDRLKPNPAGSSGDDNLLAAYLAAIPMRHNWGVLAVATLSDEYIEKIFIKIFNEHEDDGSPTMDELKQYTGWTEKWEKLKTALKMELCPEVNNSTITWGSIADFRVNHWYDFWKEKDLESRIATISEGKNTDPWLLLFPRIDLFGIAITSDESVVSFLLELFLAHYTPEELFDDAAGGNAEIARLQFKQDKIVFVDVLYLFYRLLSPRQRRQLSIGNGAAHEAIGTGLAEQIYGGGEGENPFKVWPKQICLFSRQWISTVQDLMPRYDVRESIEMFPLPGGKQTALSPWWDKFELNRAGNPADASHNENKYLQSWDSIKHMGVPVAGTWYLGVLNGGNIDLAADVMRPILSKEQEQDRLLTRSGAPVSRAVYGENDGLPLEAEEKEARLHRSHRLPYADVMRRVKMKSDQSIYNTGKIYFPFHRTQIEDYHQISRILCNLVKNVMSIKVEDDGMLDAGIGASSHPQKQNLLGEINRQVQRSFRRLDEIKSSAAKSSHAQPLKNNDLRKP